jgi:hypothetical protein
MTIRILRCKRESCFHNWTPRTDNPKWCPKCHYEKWEEVGPLTLKFEAKIGKTPIPTVKRHYRKRMQGKMSKAPVYGYCFVCQNKRLIKKVNYVTLINGRSTVRGACSSCGTKVYKIVKT